MATSISRFVVTDKNTAQQKPEIDKYRIQKYVLECWFPGHPDLLKDIRAKLREGYYADTEALLEDLRNDCALFTYCLRQLTRHLKANPKKDYDIKDFVAGLKEAPLELMDQIMPASAGKISGHKLEALPETQVLQLQSLVISTTAATTLAEKFGVEKHTAYTATVMRQLATTLVSFNYPRIHQKLVGASVMPGPEFDERIERLLGYSPVQLALDITDTWQLTDDIRQLMQAMRSAPAQDNSGNSEPAAPQPALSAASESLLALCNVSEALTSSTQTEMCGELREKWNWAKEEAVSKLGQNGFQSLEASIQAKWEPYASALPVLYSQAFSTSGAKRQVIDEHAKKRYVNNSHISKCSRMTQEKFLRVYKNMSESKPSQEALKILISELIPSTGFPRGCIYLTDQTQVRFVPLPAVMIGLENKDDFRPVFASAVGLVTDPLQKAVVSGIPVKGTTYKDMHQVIYIAGPLGCGAKRGVLYLETAHEDYLEGKADVLSYFRAIHRCLADTLHIEIPPEVM